MKTLHTLLSVGLFLAAIGKSLGQPTFQFVTSTFTVAESAGSVFLAVQRIGDTKGVASEISLPLMGRHQWIEIHSDFRDADLQRGCNRQDHRRPDLERWICRECQKLPRLVGQRHRRCGVGD